MRFLRKQEDGALSETSAPAADERSGGIDPRTTVIITNWNYGHFLADCIESVLGQSRAPDQVIVVDDGSNDASDEVLKAYAGRLEVLRHDRLGQAAAFNAGFRRATGDVIFFVDADDLLRPEAIEVVLTHWSDRFAVLSFGLETIDGTGRRIGLYRYTIDAEDGDNRPPLLRGGHFDYAPTTGNVFSRRCLEAVLPMPEEPWRTCADCYLIRAAALHGRFQVARQVLGAYRIHGANSYFRSDSLETWEWGRGLRDIQLNADALASLAERRALLDEDPREADLVALRLRLCALDLRVGIAAWTGDHRQLAAYARQCIRATLTGRLPLRDRWAGAMNFLLFGWGGSRSERLFRWARARRLPSLGLRRVLSILGIERLHNRLDELERPRWLETIPFGKALNFGERGPHQNMLAEGWLGHLRDGHRWSHASKAGIEFLVDPTPRLLEVELNVLMAPGWEEVPLQFTVDWNGERVWLGDVRHAACIRVRLDRDQLTPEQAVRLVLTCVPTDHRQNQGRGRPAPVFALESLKVAPFEEATRLPYLEIGARRRPADVWTDGALEDDGWHLGEDGTAYLVDAEGTCRLSVANWSEPCDILLVLGEDSARGWLRVQRKDSDLYFGETGPGLELRVPLPQFSASGAAEVTLKLAFQASEAADDSTLALAEVGVTRRRFGPDLAKYLAPKQAEAPRLNIGQRVYFDVESGDPKPFLKEGWSDPDDGGVRNTAAEASLEFAVPPGAVDLAIEVELQPAVPPPPGRRHVIGFSAQGKMIYQAELVGEGAVRFGLPGHAVGPGGEAVLTLHSIFAPTEPDVAAVAELATAMLELRALSLKGRFQPPAKPRRRDEGEAYERPGFARLIDVVSASLDADDRGDDLTDFRARLARTVWTSDPRALRLMCADPEAIETLERLGTATVGTPLLPAEKAIATDARGLAGSTSDQGDRLRVILAAMLLMPAFRLEFAPRLETLPAPLLWHPDSLAAWLTRPPDFVDGDEMTRHAQFLERLLVSIEAILATERPHSARYQLAVQVLTGLHTHTTRTIFGGDSLAAFIRARSRCIERFLSQTGFTLPMARRARPDRARLRIGVLLRDVVPSPEGWALLGMFRNLDRSRFEPVLITMYRSRVRLDTGDRFVEELCLGDVPIEDAVAAIRDLDLDLFMLGTYTAGWENLAAIVAHRLAPLQVLRPVFPTTSGYRSFDFALTSRTVQPPQAEADYAEQLAWIQGQLQCCYEFAGVPDAPAEAPAAARRHFGIPDDAVVLVSGAMAYKILPELMSAWSAILARAPGAILVLYPFARNWYLPYPADAFLEHLNRHLDAAGVARDRVILLDEQPPEEVRRILRASDVYLDSFPYSGATTVCEALSCGIPVVSRAGSTMRGLTGAAWVRAYGLDELVVASDEDYVAAAARLAVDADHRTAMTERIGEVLGSGPPPHFDPEAFGPAFSDALWRLAGESGLFPGLEVREIADARLGEPMPPGDEPTSTKSNDRPPRPQPRSKASIPAAKAPHRAEKAASAPPRATRVAIITAERSGSTLFCNVLNQCEGALCHFELFNRDEIQMRSGVIRDEDAIRRRDDDPVGFMENVFREGEEKGFKLIGFKIFFYQSPSVVHHLASDPDYRLIVLDRSNLLARYSSLRLAHLTGQWALTRGKRRKSAKLEFSPEDFEHYERTTTANWQRLLGLLSTTRRKALFLDYPAVASSAALERVSDFLGMPVSLPRDAHVRRQNPGSIVDRFTEPDKVRAYLEARGCLHWADDG